MTGEFDRCASCTCWPSISASRRNKRTFDRSCTFQMLQTNINEPCADNDIWECRSAKHAHKFFSSLLLSSPLHLRTHSLPRILTQLFRRDSLSVFCYCFFPHRLMVVIITHARRRSRNSTSFGSSFALFKSLGTFWAAESVFLSIYRCCMRCKRARFRYDFGLAEVALDELGFHFVTSLFFCFS